MKFLSKNYALIAVLGFAPMTSSCFLLKMLGLGLTEGGASGLMLSGDDSNSDPYRVRSIAPTHCAKNCEGRYYFE